MSKVLFNLFKINILIVILGLMANVNPSWSKTTEASPRQSEAEIELPPLTPRSAEMQPGLLESLDLGPETMVKVGSGAQLGVTKKSLAIQKKRIKSTMTLSSARSSRNSSKAGKSAKATGAKTDASVAKASAPDNSAATSTATGNQDDETKSTHSFKQDGPTMWHYLLLTIIAVAFVLIILVLIRIYRNTKVVQSPDNIVAQIKSLSSDIDSQNKYLKELKFRIQKSENSFIKVLSHHIDEKQSQLLKDVDMQFQDFAGNHKTSLKQYADLNHKVDGIESLLSTMKEFVAEQKQEIRKFHEGYDWTVINNVSVGLINVIDTIDEQMEQAKDQDEKERLQDIRNAVLVLLESHDIKESAPKVGSEYKEQKDSACKVVMVESKEPKMRGKVARVLRPSFIYRISKDQKRVIREAEIEVYN